MLLKNPNRTIEPSLCLTVPVSAILIDDIIL